MNTDPARIAPKLGQGFTLIEVLVALSIVVVSFMALYGIVLQIVGSITLMQEKTMASWVAYNQVTEVRLAGQFPGENESEGVVEMGKVRWNYEVELRDTGSDSIRQIIVKVAPEDEPERVLGLASGVLVRRGTGGPAVPPGGPGGPQFDGDGDGDGQGITQ